VTRGRLRIYLGATPGVGKTYAMLGEGHRRRDRGTDVVVGSVETHDRSVIAAQIGDLETVVRRTLEYGGATHTEMDLDAVLARRPQVALVDELAHTNVPGSRHEKRWQDIESLLEAGIDVISTLNIQHLESLIDVTTSITGVRERKTVPDAWVRSADQIELVDMSPEALRRRMAHGNVYQPDKVDAARSHFFREGNLAALSASSWIDDSGRAWVSIRVVDRGRGVGADAKSQIFAPFQRLGDVPRGDGVGLGLAVARALTEAMGGTITAEDTPGGGLTMVIDLAPAGTADAATTTRAKTVGQA
jgi:K+-sensing histidine kinase KdpD